MITSKADRKISEQLRDIADELDKRLKDVGGQPMKFSLLIFQTEQNSRMSYISNCVRDDVAEAMKLLLRGWEDGMPDVEAHKYNG